MLKKLPIFLSLVIACGLLVAFLSLPLLRSTGSDYPARSWCWHGDRNLIALHDATNTLIWIEYLVLPAILIWIGWVEGLRKVVWAFPVQSLEWAMFIFWCGLTHLLGRVEIYTAIPWLSGSVLAVCAVAGLVAIVHTLIVVPHIRHWLRSVKVSTLAVSSKAE